MAFGRRESCSDNLISYEESVDMLFRDLKGMGYQDLTKEQLRCILIAKLSVSRAVGMELCRILDEEEKWWLIR